MFRALLCSSSGGQNCVIQHLVSSHPVDGRLREASVNTIADGCILCSLASRIVTVYFYVNTGRY